MNGLQIAQSFTGQQEEAGQKQADCDKRASVNATNSLSDLSGAEPHRGPDSWGQIDVKFWRQLH